MKRPTTKPSRSTGRPPGRDRLHDAGRTYRRFLPYQFMELLGKTSISSIRLGSNVERNMTILFSDIRNFTSLSEAMTPRENFAFIN